MIKKIIITGSFIVSIAFYSLNAQAGKSRLVVNDTIKDLSIMVPQDLDRNLEEALVELKKNYRKESVCGELSQEVMAYTREDYINRLYALPSEMELAYNQIVQSYIDMYTSPRRKRSVEYMLGKGKYYFPMIEEALDKHGLPLELKYLPVIESALNPVAKSRVGATGLWQFMLRTGKMYDLEVNTLVDDRKDPRKSTEAAAKYLKDLYDIYGDWNLVIAAYNCGPGNVNKAIRRSGGFTDYWAIYPYLPRETRGYVPAFIAATYVMNYYHLHNICPMEESYPISVDTVLINNTVNLNQIAESLNIPIEDIRSLNPQYHKDIIPGEFKPYSLCLPTPVLSDFITKQDDIYNYKSNSYLTHRKVVEVENSYVSSGKATKTHKVKRGESLGSIAQKYGVSVAHLKKMNNMSSNKIYAGKQLIINRQSIQKPKTSVDTPDKKADTEKTLAVAKPIAGDNTTSGQDTIARGDFFADYYKKQVPDVDADSIADSKQEVADVTKKDILERNDNEDIRTIYHKVKIGETILQIANKYNVSTKEVLAWNNMSSKKVKIGQRLKLKVSGKAIELNKTPQAENVSETLIADNSVNQNEVKTQPHAATNQRTVRTMPDKQTSSAANKKKQQPVVYHVKKGDSLYLIAKRYKGVSAKDIMLANNLKSDKLSIGQRLNIPTN